MAFEYYASISFIFIVLSVGINDSRSTEKKMFSLQ